MKTPREILLGKHQPAMPKLDAIRQKAVGQIVDEPSPRPSPIGWERKAVGQPFLYVGRKPLGHFLVLAIQMWTELILPCRRVWTGLVTVWIFILMVNFSQRDNLNSATGRPAPSGPMVMSLQAQQHWLNQVLADRTAPVESDQPRNFSPKPRSATSRTVAL
jgi:hypothetical protein